MYKTNKQCHEGLAAGTFWEPQQKLPVAAFRTQAEGGRSGGTSGGIRPAASPRLPPPFDKQQTTDNRKPFRRYERRIDQGHVCYFIYKLFCAEEFAPVLKAVQGDERGLAG